MTVRAPGNGVPGAASGRAPRWSRGQVAGAAGVLGVLIAIAVFGHLLFRGEQAGPAGTTEVGDESAGTEFRTVTLYFADPEGTGLAAERRDLLAGGDTSTLVAATIEALAAGPLGRLAPTLPRGTRIRNVFVDREGVVYIDFSGELAAGLRGAGLSEETLLLRSLARTLGVNFRGARRLVVLVQGEPVDALAGYFDLSRPLVLSEWE